MRDLSREHRPVSELFAQPPSRDAWQRFALSEEQRASFDRDGFLARVPILDPHQVAALRDQVDRLMAPEMARSELWYEYHSNESRDPATILFHALGAWRISPGLHDILWNPALLMPASQLLGGAVRFWHDQLFCKPARHGGVVAWHQDYSYWTRTEPMQHLTCWIGLDESTRDNGCLHYIPGSHRWPLLPITGLAGDMQAIRQVLDDQQWAQFQQPVAIEMKAGEGAFHHPLLVHGSFANQTSRPRRAIVINLFRDGVRSATNDELLAGVPPVPAGQKMDGQFFPLLFDPAR
jgi:hypothetical protein